MCSEDLNTGTHACVARALILQFSSFGEHPLSFTTYNDDTSADESTKFINIHTSFYAYFILFPSINVPITYCGLCTILTMEEN